jgi:hypothetical protein
MFMTEGQVYRRLNRDCDREIKVLEIQAPDVAAG